MFGQKPTRGFDEANLGDSLHAQTQKPMDSPLDSGAEDILAFILRHAAVKGVWKAY